MTAYSVGELESAIEKWIFSTEAASKGPWNRYDGFWLVSEPRQVHFRLFFDGSVEIELFEGLACKVAPLASVHQALQLLDLFLKQRCGLGPLPGSDWKSSWNGNAVPATIIDHPEQITVAEIDSQLRDLTPPPPPPWPFGHLGTFGRSKSNSDKHLHLHPLPATGFILARSEAVWPRLWRAGSAEVSGTDWPRIIPVTFTSFPTS